MSTDLTSSLNFALRLHAHVAAQNPSSNIFLAPASVEANLAMAVNGARGATKRAVLQAMCLPENHSLRKLNGLHASLIAGLDSPHLLEAASPTSVRARRSLQLNKAFLSKTRKFYRSSASDGDLDDRQFALDRASRLFDDQSRGDIETVFTGLDGEPGVLIGTTSGVENIWARPFDRTLTKERPFTLLSGEDRRQPMMFQTGCYRYLNGDGFQAMSLPYCDQRTSMYIFLPDAETSFDRFRSCLTAENWQSWTQRFDTARGAISLPKLRLECTSDLAGTLAAMGMSAALDVRRADFGALCSRTRLHIASMMHKASLVIGEHGVDPTAGPDNQSAQDEAQFCMIVDRPFFCAVCDDQTGTPLLLGSIVNP